MACSCRGRNNYTYVWTSADGQTTMTYESEIQAKAKVLRVGGTYVRQG